MWGRRLLWRFSNTFMVDPLLAPPINKARATLGLSRVRDIATWWHSPQSILGLFPDWFAPVMPDWPPNVTLAGFPLFDESNDEPLAPEVAAFLDAGPPPIVFTAGSAMRHGGEFFTAAVEACERLGRRGALLARFDGQIPTNLPASVRHFAYVPFSQILPRSAALVHHGGIGTTAQGLAAGIPQLVVPMAHDQPDNAERLKRLGVGGSLVPKRFNGRNAAEALGRLLGDPQVVAGANALAARVDRGAALAKSCEVIEAALQRPARVGVGNN
jgi:UDP:flavonoid glycosyltransferase YjiC (YdhE family)